jgi:hypothetical protein
MSLSDLWRTETQDWVHGWLDANQTPGGSPAGDVKPDASYLSVFLKSARVVNVRSGFTKFYGAVHSLMRLPQRSAKMADFNVITTPTELKNVDSDGIDRVIQMNHRLLGPVPYVDGDLDVEVGLFSVETSNLAAPYLNLLESLSKTAGVSFISAATPFAAPILEGVKLLTSGNRDTVLEIGLAMSQQRPRQGIYVAMRAPKSQVKLSDLKVDPSDYRLLTEDGEPMSQYPYFVLEFSASSQRPDWYMIPEIAAAYAHVQSLYREGSPETASAVEMFRRTALTCNDLVSDDAAALAARMSKLYQLVAPGDATRGGSVPGAALATMPDLRSLNLYG